MRSMMMAAAGALVLLVAIRAEAEEQGPVGEQESAERLFARGGELFEEGRYEDALAAYQRSYEISPVNVVLYNIAMCQRALGRTAAAIQTFDRYLYNGGDRIPTERQQEVRALIAELRGRGGRQPGGEGAEPGDEGSDEPAPSVVEPTPRAAVEPPSAAEPEPRPARDRGRSLRLAAYFSGAVAVAVLGTSLGLFAWNSGRSDEWEQTSADLAAQWMAPERDLDALDVLYQQNHDRGEDLQRWGAAEWALLAVGVAALGAAVALLVVGLRARRPASASSAPCGGFCLALSPAAGGARP